ncbi:MAG TPA: magnesium/cobalt transporter CorA [bacterium]|nr:magnesium/cobalt transporter CorA [bacterium]HOL66710.1 magnesium/cobalt transporter CorA [bacterium]
MNRKTAARRKKVGLPAGSLAYFGQSPARPTRITLFEYTPETISEKKVEDVAALVSSEAKKGVTWLNIDGFQNVEAITEIGQFYHLHPLVMEDILTMDQRPRVEDFDDYLFITLRMFYLSASKEIVDEQLSLILGENFLLSFQEMPGDIFDPVRERLRSGKGRLRNQGPDYLTYSLIDAVVDNYFVILEELGEQIEETEKRLLASPSPEKLSSIFALKRKLIFMRRSLWPLREAINNLLRSESKLVTSTTLLYLRDVHDHTIQAIETLETLRDILSEMVDIYLSSQSNRLNEIMKVLTIIATIFMPLTFIAGIYGMNFKYMPELNSVWGYPAVLLFMALIAAVMLFYFRKQKWL